MKLLKYENYQVTPSEELFLVKAFRVLYEKDTSETKDTFMDQLSFIFFVYDPRSSYADIFDESERIDRVIVEEGLSKKFRNPSKELTKAIERYKELTVTTSQKLLDSMRKAVARLGEFMENFNPYDAEDGLKQAQAAKQLSAIANDVPVLAKKLMETEKLVESEITEVTRIRGGQETAHAYEDGI